MHLRIMLKTNVINPETVWVESYYAKVRFQFLMHELKEMFNLSDF